MTTYKLTNPVSVGTLNAPVTVAALAVTSVWFSTTPQLAPLGTAELQITLTDPVSGWQEVVTYQDASVLEFFSQLAPTPPTGATYADVLAASVFAKLVADGKLPAGAVTQS